MDFKKILPHVLAVVMMVAAAFVFFAPSAFDGKVLQQPDNQKATASQVEIKKFEAQTGKPILWTGAYFSGMPTAQIYQKTKNNYTEPVFRAAFLGGGVTSPHAGVLLAMLSTYFLLIVLGLDWRIALMGATVYGLSNYNMDIIEAGHSTKMAALAFAPAMLGAAIMTFRGQLILGGGLFALFTALQIYANHYQITYYTFLILGLWAIQYLVQLVLKNRKTNNDALENNQNSGFKSFLMGCMALGLATILGAGANTTSIWTTYEYQKYSTRGASDLTKSVSQNLNKDGGLSPDYVFGWSLGLGESATLLVPYAYGGGASQDHSATKTYKIVRGSIAQQMASQPGVTGAEIDKTAARQANSLFYFGSQPFVGVSIYFGIIVMFLAFLGMGIAPQREKWWLFAAAILMMCIAWGDNFFIAPLMYDYFPLFSKFRAVTQALGLAQLAFVGLAGLGLQAWFNKNIDGGRKNLWLYVAGGSMLFLCLAAMTGNFVGKVDANPNLQSIVATLQNDRESLASADAWRSIGLLIITAGLLWFSLRNKALKPVLAVGIIVLMAVGDVWFVSRRTLDEKSFSSVQAAKDELKPDAADLKVMEDKDPHYRVLDMRGGDPFQTAQTSMFHKSVGGYHAAKMRIIQEMVDKYFLNKTVSQEQQMKLYGMLNAKYVITQPTVEGIIKNPYVLGNAWFVRDVKLVNSPDEELDAVGNIDPRTTVVMQKSNAEAIGATSTNYDSTATIKLTEYTPDKMSYEFSSKTEQIAVFSEVFYPKGWKMSIDGQPAKDFVKANYLVRAAKLPAGTHKLEMIYEPAAYYTGEKLSMVASLLVLVSLFLGLSVYFRRSGMPTVAMLPSEMPIAEAKPKQPTPPQSRRK
ncbi:MAG: hypothetical protein RL757_320 [Bacteroidota bacterium]|jgi:hypothetical protein